MDTKFHFTTETVRKASCPEGRERIRYMDTKTLGLGLRVTAAGVKTFTFYRFLPRDNENPLSVCEIRIGKADVITVEQARALAKSFNTVVDFEKRDPSRRPEEKLTYSILFDRYIKEYAQLRTKTWQDAVYNHNLYFKRWHDAAISNIKRTDVQHWVNDLAHNHGKHTANRHYNTLRAVLSWGLKKEIWQGDTVHWR